MKPKTCSANPDLQYSHNREMASIMVDVVLLHNDGIAGLLGTFRQWLLPCRAGVPLMDAVLTYRHNGLADFFQVSDFAFWHAMNYELDDPFALTDMDLLTQDTTIWAFATEAARFPLVEPEP